MIETKRPYTLPPQLMRQRFPQLQVVEGSADCALDNLQTNEAITVVSSLPFRSLPAAIKLVPMRSVLQFLAASPGSTVIQYTYGLKEPFATGSGFECKPVKWIFANVLPARIWTLTKSRD
ncbi:MAG: hypothetical protein ABI478_07755 [Propionivibrio sp.]